MSEKCLCKNGGSDVEDVATTMTTTFQNPRHARRPLRELGCWACASAATWRISTTVITTADRPWQRLQLRHGSLTNSRLMPRTAHSSRQHTAWPDMIARWPRTFHTIRTSAVSASISSRRLLAASTQMLQPLAQCLCDEREQHHRGRSTDEDVEQCRVVEHSADVRMPRLASATCR